jgi:hypothetical protein
MNARSFRQRGITMVVVTLAMLSVIAIGGLALDMGHVTANKARLQATVDAAALSAAEVLNTTNSTAQATTAANNVFVLNAAQQPELAAVLGSVTRNVQFSNTLIPFTPGSVPALYARVQASGFNIAASLARVLGFNNFAVSANAVAGPSPTINSACNVAPLMICGTTPTIAKPIFGYAASDILALKLSAGSNPSDLGPGNYRLLSLGGTGGDVVRGNLAGGYEGCADVGSNVLTQPGNQAGPVAQGLNTRFNQYGANLSSGTYPPDVIINQGSGNSRLSCQTAACTTVVTGPGGNTVVNTASQYPAFNYTSMYLSRLTSSTYDIAPAPNGIGVINRRVLTVPVGDCTVVSGGRNDIPVLGMACVYVLQDVDQGGQGGQIFGEILSQCQVNGTPGPAPGSGPGPFIIQLYHVDGSTES